MYKFWAFLNRMKFIKRWSLMYSVKEENIMEHSWQVTTIAHALALIKNKKFGGAVDEKSVVLLAQYHETGEVITGDLPTPIKYFNQKITEAYKDLEVISCEKLVKKLPEELQGVYAEMIFPDKESIEAKIVKQADRICALIKCMEEIKAGNSEFKKAKQTILKDINKFDSEECKYFIENILPSFDKTLDEMND